VPKEITILLFPDEDLESLGFHLLATWIMVDAADRGVGTKVLAPELKRSPVADSDLKQGEFLPAVLPKVSLIQWEVVPPLCKSTVGVFCGELLERL
jgi:hypothetical protein